MSNQVSSFVNVSLSKYLWQDRKEKTEVSSKKIFAGGLCTSENEEEKFLLVGLHCMQDVFQR